MTQAITIGVPVRNESFTISTTLDSVLRQNRQLELEVIVCANACTDNGATERIVSEIAADDRRVKLINSEPGKPNAWNKIIDTAKYNDILFIDGDVVVGNGSVHTIIDFMNKGKYIAASSKMKKILKSKNPFGMVLNYPLTQHNFHGICGRMYSLRRSELLTEMLSKGYKKMPEDLISEDTWISLILEKRQKGKVVERKWGYCQNAIVYHQPPNKYDRFKRAINMAEGSLQLSLEYPELGYTVITEKTLIQRLSRRFSQWKNYNFKQKLVIPINFIKKRIKYEYFENRMAMKIAKRNYEQGKHTNIWHESISTKQRLPLELYLNLIK